MKRILFIYPSMMMGGSTKSLISLLEKLVEDGGYHIDLILQENGGVLYDMIPSKVNVLPTVNISKGKAYSRLRRLTSVNGIFTIIKYFFVKVLTRNEYIAAQVRYSGTVEFYRHLSAEYDIAVSYMESWPMYYLVKNVNSKKKVAWIHVDYVKMGYKKKYDIPYFESVDKIVFVSEECRRSFISLDSSYADKAVVVENMISKKMIRELSKEVVDFAVDYNNILFITVARIEIVSKAFDRTLRVFEKILHQNPRIGWHWYIIGNGSDVKRVKSIIHNKHLGDNITLLGEQVNPYKYISKCDYFLLVSYFEGKPVSVEESKILGIPPIVTRYSSAREQVEDGINGIICDNSEEGVYTGIMKALTEYGKPIKFRNSLRCSGNIKYNIEKLKEIL